MLIYPAWYKILKIWQIPFELIEIEVQCSKNYFKILLPQEAGGFGNNIEKEPQKLHPNLKKCLYYLFTQNVYSACNLMQVVVFSKNVLIL